MDEKKEFSLTYKSYSKKFDNLLLYHMKGITRVYRADPGNELKVVHDNLRAVKGDHKSTGEKIIIFLSKKHFYENDIVQWEPHETLAPEYWKVKKIELQKPWIICSVEYFRMEDANVVILLRKRNFHEAADFLSNAIELVQGDKPVKFSDCKNNCRKAFSSFFKETTGSEDFREAIKILVKKKYAGDIEGDLCDAFDKLAAKLRDFLAKKGSHIPTAQKEEARLAAEVTEAFLRYFVTKFIK